MSLCLVVVLYIIYDGNFGYPKSQKKKIKEFIEKVRMRNSIDNYIDIIKYGGMWI